MRVPVLGDSKNHNKEEHITPRNNKTMAYDKSPDKNLAIDKKDFNGEIHQSADKGIVTAIDKTKKPYKIIKVTKEEFDKNDNLIGSNTLLIRIFDEKDNLIIEELGSIKKILKENYIPLSLSTHKNKKYSVNTSFKSKDFIDYLKKFEGWHWTSERVGQ